MGEHVHQWTPWSMNVPQYDSLGNRLLLAGKPYDSLATLHGTARPLTKGWSRWCRCGATESS